MNSQPEPELLAEDALNARRSWLAQAELALDEFRG